MVRFSDMLGGNADADGPGATPAVPPAPPASEAEADVEAEHEDDPQTEVEVVTVRPDPPPVESPEEVLNRLRQYASSARAADPAPRPAEAASPPAEDPHEPEPVEEQALTPVGDDLLPHAKNAPRKSGRDRKRR